MFDQQVLFILSFGIDHQLKTFCDNRFIAHHVIDIMDFRYISHIFAKQFEKLKVKIRNGRMNMSLSFYEIFMFH